MPRAAIDERGAEALRRVREAHTDLTLSAFKVLVREQYNMLLIDQKAALAAIPSMLPPDTDTRVKALDDGLPVRLDLVDVLIEIENPAECLLGRRDVVTLRAEHHDGRANIAQIDRGAVRCLDLTCGKLCCRRTVRRR